MLADQAMNRLPTRRERYCPFVLATIFDFGSPSGHSAKTSPLLMVITGHPIISRPSKMVHLGREWIISFLTVSVGSYLKRTLTRIYAKNPSWNFTHDFDETLKRNPPFIDSVMEHKG
jgi:hypothetical protein